MGRAWSDPSLAALVKRSYFTQSALSLPMWVLTGSRKGPGPGQNPLTAPALQRKPQHSFVCAHLLISWPCWKHMGRTEFCLNSFAETFDKAPGTPTQVGHRWPTLPTPNQNSVRGKTTASCGQHRTEPQHQGSSDLNWLCKLVLKAALLTRIPKWKQSCFFPLLNGVMKNTAPFPFTS